MKISSSNFPAMERSQLRDSKEIRKTNSGSKPKETGNTVAPLIDGPAIFASAKEMMKSAESTIQLEMYSLDRKEMLDLLCSEANKGINVQVMLDPSHERNPRYSDGFKKMKAKLKANGVEVLNFPTDKRWIDHVKLLIVDGKSALVGGMNWGEHSSFNHDADVKLEGPAVNYYRNFFNDGWKRSGGENILELPKAEKIPGATAEIAGACTNTGDHSIKSAVVKSIDKAKKSIHMETFILSDKDIVAGLLAAKHRGVEVKVLMDPTGVKNGASLNGQTFETLKDAGIEVKWYTVDTSVHQMLHAKWGVFDDQELLVGSANWSRNGLTKNREIGIHVKDENTTTAFEEQFQHDWVKRSSDKLPV